jgi:hypothetical protein
MTHPEDRALSAGTDQGCFSLLCVITRCVGIEWIRDLLDEEILQIVLVEDLVDVDGPVDGIPGRVPIRIAWRGVGSVRGIGSVKTVRVCHSILLRRDTRRIDAETADGLGCGKQPQIGDGSRAPALLE